MYAKRKNDEPGAFPRWILLIALGFALGVIVTLALRPDVYTTVSPPDNIDPAIALTASAIVQGATQTVAAGSNGDANPTIDPFQITATALIQEATQQANG